MKKSIIIALLFLPVMSMAAPSVKKFGGVVPVAGGGVKSSVAAKVTPTKITGAPVGANMARIGSLKLKSAVAGSTTTGGTSTSGVRFPMIPSLKVYNSAATPKVAAFSGSGAIAEVSDLDERVTGLENKTADKPIVTSVNTLVEHDDTVNIGRPWIGSSVENRTETPPTGRAWIWVEE